MGRRLIVQIPNHPGELDRLARALVARGVDVARVAECGRGEHVCALLSVSDEATDDVLRGMGIEPVEGECVSMAVADADGAIVELTSKLRDGGVAVIRSCVIGRAGPGQVEVGLAVDDAARARDVLDLAARETAVPA